MILGAIVVIAIIAGAFCLYFLPAIVGRKKRNRRAITVLNLLLGWTILGWVIALVWACTVDSEKLSFQIRTLPEDGTA
jgi:G:T-mismatch repair DNA endonuclease (very short patch repair protein)